DAGRIRAAVRLDEQQGLPAGDALEAAFGTLFESKVHLAESMSHQVSATERSHKRLSVILIILATLIGVVASWWIVRGIARAVREMLAAAERIGAGDLTVSVKARTSDEIGQMATAFQAMITRLRGTVQGIGEAATTLSATSQQLAAASEEAGKAVGEIAHA